MSKYRFASLNMWKMTTTLLESAVESWMAIEIHTPQNIYVDEGSGQPLRAGWREFIAWYVMLSITTVYAARTIKTRCRYIERARRIDGWLRMGLLPPPPPPREFCRHILSCRELNPESFKRCLHSVLRGVSL